MRILTNMRFWQSRAWCEAVTSIYPGHRLPLGRKPLSPLREALELCRRSRDYDIVVTMGARESLLYGLLCALRGRPSRQIACEVFVDDPAQAGLLWKMKNSLYRFTLRRAVGLLTNSSAEIATAVRRFGLPRERIIYVPLHTNISNPTPSPYDDGFVFTAGATRRDYATFIAAMAGIDVPAILVCPGEYDLPRTIPSHIEVKRDIPRDEYLDLLRRCSFVVVPLIPAERATGQVVVLEAMAHAKPVIATQSAGTVDLIQNRINGLLVPPRDPAALAEAIRELIGNPELRQQMGAAALQRVLREHTIEIHAARKLAAIRELAERYGTADARR